jgi:plastocyanin
MVVRHTILICSLAASAACGSSTDHAAAKATAPPATTTTGSEVSGTVPRNAIVALVPAAAPSPLPEGPAVMDQYAKQFVPNSLYVRIGQPVEFRNSEDMPHNVQVSRRGTGTHVFNVGTEPHQKYVHTFDRIGQYDVLCDIHPGMQATVIAVNTAIATVADDAGRFALANVPLGSYKLNLTFEGRTIEQPLEVSSTKTPVAITR